ncbi:MAG: homoserine O-succinyltransferase [Clostridiales bacterium]|nr:homoserine O-succinyltransferase [Clostridiales bacterium]
MPIRIDANLPAKKILEDENIFVMDYERSMRQDIRPLRILIMNLMPTKEETELQLLRSLANTPLQVDVTFLTMASHTSKNTPISHLESFYTTFASVREDYYDGLIITGAPVETYDYEDVDYWPELVDVMEWSKTHVTSTFHICWAAQAGLYYHYGVRKFELKEKIFGIFKHRTIHRKIPLVRGFDDIFNAPHSRHTGICREDVENNPELNIVADSEEAGPFIIMAKEGRQIFVTGHPEYDVVTLDGEYKRDLAKGMDNVPFPCRYYEDDDPAKGPVKSWRCHANTLYTNWLNYYVYQMTPYISEEIKNLC